MNLERTLTSNEVAEMVGRRHDQVLRDIEKVITQLGDHKNVESYFKESTYKNIQNKELPSFCISKKGCELYSTRMTGEKGTQFAVAYIEKFNQMENHIKTLDTSNLSPELQMFNGLFQSLANQELATKNLETKVNNISEIVSLDSNDWRRKVNKILRSIATKVGGMDAYKEIGTESYELLEKRGKCDLNRRLDNRKKNMIVEGVGKTKVKKLNKLDVIGDDTRLLEIYLSVVKDMAIKYQVDYQEI